MSQLSLDGADEDFFGTLEGNKSNLSQLFGIQNPQQENPTLKYQAPKPSTSETASEQKLATAGANWSVVLAKVVTAYKNSTPIGKVGVALLRNVDEGCKIIVYKTKTNVLATLTLHLEAAQAIYRQTPYLQFYDDVQCYWSLLFDKESDEAQFVEKLKELNVDITALEQKNQMHSQQSDESKIQTTLQPPEDEINKTKTEVLPEHYSKATLVSRMAKMGTKLPIITSATTEYSDSSDTEVISTPLPMNNKPAVAPRINKLTQRSHYAAATSSNSNFVGVYNSGNNFPLQVQETQFMHMLLTENRTQITEIRMNINKLESKIEKVLDKMDLMGTANASKSNKEDEILELEEKLLELKKENRKLKQAQDGIQKTQNEVTSYEKFSTRHAIDLDDLKIFSHNSWETLGETLIECVKNLQIEYIKLEVENTKLSNELQEKTEKQLEQSSTLTKSQLNLKSLENELKNSKEEIVKQQHAVKELQTKIEVMEKTQAEEISRQSSQIQTTIKEIMNNLYGNIATKLDKIPNGNMANEQILAMVGKEIRNETMKIMQAKC